MTQKLYFGVVIVEEEDEEEHTLEGNKKIVHTNTKSISWMLQIVTG